MFDKGVWADVQVMMNTCAIESQHGNESHSQNPVECLPMNITRSDAAQGWT
jgi:hypothetical protein